MALTPDSIHSHPGPHLCLGSSVPTIHICPEARRVSDAPASLQDANFLAPSYRGILVPEEVFSSGFGKQLPGAVEVVWGYKLKQAVLPGGGNERESTPPSNH